MTFRRLVVFLLASAASVAQAQTVANGPYYATPAWDQTLPAATRFIVLANFNSEAVLDRETGLVWERTPSASRTNYAFSVERCEIATTGGRAGWRLPRYQELSTLLEPNPTGAYYLPAGHPFIGVETAFPFYTTTPDPINAPGNLKALSFAAGGSLSTNPATERRIWCVRAAP